MSINPPLFFTISILLLGVLIFTLWGSFLAAAYFRLLKRYDLDNPQYLSIWIGRSSCMACDKKLAWYQLIPLLSWIFYRGRCGYCQSKISPFYVLFEVFTPLLFLAHLGVGLTIWEAGFLTLIATTLLVMSLIDFHAFILPDDLQLVLFILWFMALLCPPFTPELLLTYSEGLMGLLFTTLLLLGLRALFLSLRQVDAIGFGDIKLAGIAGLWLGIWHVPWMLLIASVGTLGVVLINMIRRKDVTLRTQLPFGPGLAAGFYVTMFIKIIINKI